MCAADRTAGTVTLAVGIDVGGTKIAAGVVDVDTRRAGAALCRPAPTAAEPRCSTTAPRSPTLGGGTLPIGIGLCELVDLAGRPTSADTVDWRDLEPTAAIAAPRVVVESDLRAAALAEARLGAGVGVSPFLFVIVGTGASACLVLDGSPYAGAHGEAITLARRPSRRSRAVPRWPGPPGSRGRRTCSPTPPTPRSSRLPRRRSAACSPSSPMRSTRH